MTSGFLRSFAGAKVLVTGHTGFKGAWLCSWLSKLGADVYGISLAPSAFPNLYSVLDLSSRIDSRYLDIRDRVLVGQAMKEIQPEFVLHLAAQSLVRRSYAEPLDTFQTNIIGTANILDAARQQQSVRAVVCVTTDKVYYNKEWVWSYREIDELGGLDPYSASKACAEFVTRVYQRRLLRANDPVRIATARGGNVVGGGDWAEDRLIPDIVRALTFQHPIRLRNPCAIRPWQHVLELCEGYLRLTSSLMRGDEGADDAWNFGPMNREDLSVEQVVSLMLARWGNPDYLIEREISEVPEAQILRIDASKAISRLNWLPRLSIQDTVEWTTDWYKRFVEDPSESWKVTSDQISRYESMMSFSG